MSWRQCNAKHSLLPVAQGVGAAQVVHTRMPFYTDGMVGMALKRCLWQTLRVVSSLWCVQVFAPNNAHDLIDQAVQLPVSP